jgi:hypothetical protein
MSGATVVLYSDPAGTTPVASQSVGSLSVMPGTDVKFNNVLAQSVRVNIDSLTGTFNGQSVASLAEVEVIARGEAALTTAPTETATVIPTFTATATATSAP